jgi:hypothetical protein
MTAKSGVRETLRSAFFENVGLKAVSLICSLGLYAFIHGAENAQRTFSVSVVSIMPTDSAKRQLMTPLPTEVKVTLRGSRTQLDDLRTDDLGTLQINLRTGYEPNVELSPEMFHVPAGLRIEEIYPATIEVRWDDVVKRSISLQIPRTGEPAAGFIVKTASAEPASVSARGPRSVVDVMQYARAAPFDVTGLTEGIYRRQLALDKPPKLVDYDVESVLATVEVVRELSKKDIGSLKVEVVGLPRATTTPSRVTVRVIGAPEDVNALSPEVMVARVEPKEANIDAAKPGSAMLDVLVDVPKAKVVEVNPPRVLVKW